MGKWDFVDDVDVQAARASLRDAAIEAEGSSLSSCELERRVILYNYEVGRARRRLEDTSESDVLITEGERALVLQWRLEEAAVPVLETKDMFGLRLRMANALKGRQGLLPAAGDLELRVCCHRYVEACRTGRRRPKEGRAECQSDFRMRRESTSSLPTALTRC